MLNSKPKEVFYRDYKNFDINKFNCHLNMIYEITNLSEYKNFEKTYISVLDQHAPCKKKLIRANHAPYVSKFLRKAIMKRSTLEKKYYKKPTETNLRAYK